MCALALLAGFGCGSSTDEAPARDPGGGSAGVGSAGSPGWGGEPGHAGANGWAAEGGGGAAGSASGGAAGSGGASRGDDPCGKATLGPGHYCAKSLDPSSSDDDTLYVCSGSHGTVQSQETCALGCRQMPDGEADRCESNTVVPALIIEMRGAYFNESDIRAPLEAGFAYMLERTEALTGVHDTGLPTLTIYYYPSSERFAEGLAGVISTWGAEVWVPDGHDLTGPSQNFVTNLSVHELAHLAAAHYFGGPNLREWCLNEGLATWMSGKYWKYMNGAPASFREYARANPGYRDLSYCYTGEKGIVGDAPYKVWASYLEYLEETDPSAIAKVATGAVPYQNYEAGWRAWLE
ncbi:MAG: hypothetical protein OZ921_21100 [Sorangiineae bacterium]|nr:hypothetical protein [Sorangiineae bacterium]